MGEKTEGADKCYASESDVEGKGPMDRVGLDERDKEPHEAVPMTRGKGGGTTRDGQGC